VVFVGVVLAGGVVFAGVVVVVGTGVVGVGGTTTPSRTRYPFRNCSAVMVAGAAGVVDAGVVAGVVAAGVGAGVVVRFVLALRCEYRLYAASAFPPDAIVA
jgi:hypothetical protein